MFTNYQFIFLAVFLGSFLEPDATAEPLFVGMRHTFRAATGTVTDVYGDPLPPGAVKRLGIRRLRLNGPITALAFSPDGQRLAAAATGRHNAVVWWEVTTGKEVARLANRNSDVHGLALTPDGRMIASCSTGTVQLWAVGQENPAPLLETTTDSRSMAFSADGTMLAFAKKSDSTLASSDATTHSETRGPSGPGGFPGFFAEWSDLGFSE